MAIMDLIRALIGHFEGTNIGYMGIYCHICIRIVPPYWRWDSRGLSPWNSLGSPPNVPYVENLNYIQLIPRVRDAPPIANGRERLCDRYIHSVVNISQ